MNLANLGLSGLTVAQHQLQTTGHNINNVATEGYNRQSVLVSTAGASATSAGFIGRGVQAVTVERAYDAFLQRQLSRAQAESASIASYGAQIAQLNNLLAERTVGIAPALQRFFDGVQAVASAPADSAARQELLGRAASLVGQFNDTNAFLSGQRDNLNNQIQTSVTQINSYAERIRDLNIRVMAARATGPGQEPNDLLDQRDLLVSELGQLVGVNVIEQGGQINLVVGNGQLLLAGSTVLALHAQPSPEDSGRVTVAYTVPGRAGEYVTTPFAEGYPQGGSLGGLLAYRREALDTVQNALGRLAVGLAQAFNAVHETGQRLDGGEGEAFFALSPVTVLPAQGNSGVAGLTASLKDANALTLQDYRVTRSEVGFTVTAIPGGRVTEFNEARGEIDGLVFDVDGETRPGDTWLVQPTRQGASGLVLRVNDPAGIAAASPDAGSANGDVALALAQLQTDKVLGRNTLNLNDAFSQIVNTVGVLSQKNATQARAQEALLQQSYAAQQAVSGVNLNEEQVRLLRYQEQFMAAARLIDVSGVLFDTLLGLKR